MKQIYEQATKVLVWLGIPEDEDNNRLAFAMMEDCARKFRHTMLKDRPYRPWWWPRKPTPIVWQCSFHKFIANSGLHIESSKTFHQVIQTYRSKKAQPQNHKEKGPLATPIPTSCHPSSFPLFPARSPSKGASYHTSAQTESCPLPYSAHHTRSGTEYRPSR